MVLSVGYVEFERSYQYQRVTWPVMRYVETPLEIAVGRW